MHLILKPLLFLSLTLTSYFLWDLIDFSYRVKKLRVRLNLNKEIDSKQKLFLAIPFVLVLFLLQPFLGIGLALFMVLLYYFDKEFIKANYIKAIEDELPYFLSLMSVTIRAGLSTNTALYEIVKRMKPSPLKKELVKVVQEMRLGLGRREALENWSKRMGNQQVSFLVQSWVQSEELGTEPSEVLLFLSNQLFDRKVRQVEGEAMQAGVKITVPLAFLIFPAVMIIIFGPIIIGGI